jgi:hypothetical protein
MVAAGRAGWGELLGRIGRSAVDLWRAELLALRGELGESGRVLVRAVLLAAVGGFLAFWTLGLMFTAVVAALALVLPLWAAAGIVLVITGVAAYLVWRAARERFLELESPWITMKRRVSDHAEWWQDQMLPPPDEGDEAGAGQTEEER